VRKIDHCKANLFFINSKRELSSTCFLSGLSFAK